MRVPGIFVPVGILLTLSVAASARAQSRSSAPSLTVLVTTRAGEPVADAAVQVEGHLSREGTTDADGTVVFGLMTPGTYRCRIERQGYVTLEKDVEVKATGRSTVEASLSPAERSASTAPARSEFTPGDPRILDITQLAAEALKERGAEVERVIGCSGAASTRLLRLLEDLPPRTRDDADQTVYVVAGEASLEIGGLEQDVSAGSIGIIPRGTSYRVSRRGRNPLLLLTVVSGPACVE